MTFYPVLVGLDRLESCLVSEPAVCRPVGMGGSVGKPSGRFPIPW